ncbi:LysR family transcriptional regulator [Azohydromonas aeria]|uniref:LysR family transcriptional regulator n=1 Tax=Azohydromonas aeria TaxID=2590212 RepID=UPI0012FAAAD3|nr:LysR family transcriptional regulator [Azohydromonas aeria]
MPDPIAEELTFRKLQVLLAFMDTGNLARAAERLNTSPVSVHRALHSLEAGLRCTLFRHEGRNLLPTPAAQVLAESAREVLRGMAEGIRATREAAGYGSDRMRIGSLYSLTSRTVPRLVVGLQQRRPDLQTDLVLGSNAELLRKLREGSADAALLGLPADVAEMACEPLFEDDMHFAAPADSPYARMAAVDLAACANERFVSLTEGFVTSGGFAEAFRLAGFMPQVVMRTGDIFSLMNLVHGGMGCTLLPGRVRRALPAGVVLVPLQEPYRMHQTIALVFLRTRERDPNLLALLAEARAARAELV